MKHQVFAWDNTKSFETPLLIVGKRLYQEQKKLKKGMLIYRLGAGTKYRVDDFHQDPSEEADKGTFKMNITHIKHDGSDGNKGTAYSVAHVWIIKTADIAEGHQPLLLSGEVEGTIKDDIFIPHKRYLVNWHEQYMNYFRFIRSRGSYDHKNPAKSELPNLLLGIIDEIGPAAFNSFIRHFFVDEKCEDDTMAAAHKAIRQIGPIGNDDESKRFAERMLYTAIHMGNDFWEATQAIVYKKGVVMDFTERIR